MTRSFPTTAISLSSSGFATASHVPAAMAAWYSTAIGRMRATSSGEAWPSRITTAITCGSAILTTLAVDMAGALTEAANDGRSFLRHDGVHGGAGLL